MDVPRHTRWLAWGLWGFTLAVVIADLALVPITRFNVFEDSAFGAAVVALGSIGVAVVTRRPGSRAAWLLLVVAAFASFTGLGPQIGQYAVRHSSLGAGWGKFGVVVLIVGLTGMFAALSVLGITAPDGRLPRSRWRYAIWVPVAFVGTQLLALVLALPAMTDPIAVIEGEAMTDTSGVRTTGIGAVFHVVNAIASTLWIASVTVAGLALVARLRRSEGDERQQLKWIVYGVVLGLSIPIFTLVKAETEPLHTIQEAGIGLAMLGVAVGFGLALFRYRLYDVDFVVNRSLVYAALTAGIVTVYLVVVFGLGQIVGDRSNVQVSLVATAIVVLVFNPARLRLQRLVNRMMFGDRDDPYGVLSRLGRTLEASLTARQAVQAATETLCNALRLPFAAVEAADPRGYARIAEHGVEPREVTAVPLRHGGSEIGRLLVAARGPGQALTPADLKMVDEVARQLAAAVFTARLTEDLQRSRQKLVTAREEERRRLRRDLHDGLGPTLAGIGLQLDTARHLLRDDPDRVEEVLERLRTEAATATADVRRLVYDLRPPALDELGLAGALRGHAEKLDGGALRVQVETDDLADLPAAIEVAAYRIALEAMTNVARHSDADRCTVRLRCDGPLRIEVVDDGQGIAEAVGSGVGLRSMRERAQELGGHLAVEPVDGGGTRVTAEIPLAAEAEGAM